MPFLRRNSTASVHVAVGLLERLLAIHHARRRYGRAVPRRPWRVIVIGARIAASARSVSDSPGLSKPTAAGAAWSRARGGGSRMIRSARVRRLRRRPRTAAARILLEAGGDRFRAWPAPAARAPALADHHPTAPSPLAALAKVSPVVVGAPAVAAHRDRGLRASMITSAQRARDQLDRADRVVVAGNRHGDQIGIGIGVDDRDDRDPELVGLGDGDASPSSRRRRTAAPGRRFIVLMPDEVLGELVALTRDISSCSFFV